MTQRHDRAGLVGVYRATVDQQVEEGKSATAADEALRPPPTKVSNGNLDDIGVAGRADLYNPTFAWSVRVLHSVAGTFAYRQHKILQRRTANMLARKKAAHIASCLCELAGGGGILDVQHRGCTISDATNNENCNIVART